MSNMLIKHGIIYYASKQILCAIDINGTIIWQAKLPKEITGKSTLAFNDTMLVFVNQGYASKGQSKILYGTPYLAVINSKTGEQYFLKKINLEANAISDFKLHDNLICLSAFIPV